MTKAARSIAVLTVAVLASAPIVASAQTARVHDRSGDASRAVDMTSIKVRHGQSRIMGAIRIPGLKPGKLSGTELLIATRGKKKVYAVTVLRNRRGKVVRTNLSWRPLNDPVEPTVLPCKRIRTALPTKHSVVVAVPKPCLTKTGLNRHVRAKVRTINGTRGLQGAYFDDQTRFTAYLKLGRTHAADHGPRAGPAYRRVS